MPEVKKVEKDEHAKEPLKAENFCKHEFPNLSVGDAIIQSAEEFEE